MRCFMIFEYYTKEKAGFDSVLFCFRIESAYLDRGFYPYVAAPFYSV